MKQIFIAPSILSADFSKIGQEVSSISDLGADFIHLDVMDGNFVKNITYGPKFIKDLRDKSDKIFDTHLMILNPIRYVDDFVKAGSDIITVHYEACKEDLKDTLKAIKSNGVKCGVVINPDTEVSAISNVIGECDMLLLMSVFPGFGGQKFIPEVLNKLKQADELIKSVGKDILLEIDGGINLDNVKLVKDAGANVIVAGNSIFKENDRGAIIEKFKNA